MITLAIILIAWAILKKVQQKRIVQRRAQAYIPAAEIQRSQKEREKAQRDAERAEAKRQREAEKARKAEQARQLAQIELDHLEFLKGLYGEQFDALDAEQKSETTSETRRAKIGKEILKLDEKRYKIELQIAKTHYKAQQIAQN